MNVTNTPCTELKEYYNNTLNKDKSLYETSNDVSTPIDCIEEMVSKVPESFWKNPEIKILDPCCGCGNFFLVINDILLKYHTQDYIIKNILYFNDINNNRLEIAQEIFPKGNFTHQDFLIYSEDTKYDMIIANPPYAKFTLEGKRAAKNHNLIGNFLDKSFSILKDKGILVYIIPDNWMTYSNRNNLVMEITSKQILHLNIHTAKKYFKDIGSSFTWFVLENTPFYKDISIEGIWNKEYYIDYVPSQIRNFIPLWYTKIIKSIVNKTLDTSDIMKFKIETSSNLHRYTKRHLISTSPTKIYKYKLIHTASQTVYSKEPHKYQEGYKVFINLTGYYKVFVDNCGMTQSIAFIRCLNFEDAEEIMKILNHPLYVFLNNIHRYGNFNNVKILQAFPQCKTFDTVYKELKFTKNEINFIEKLKKQCLKQS